MTHWSKPVGIASVAAVYLALSAVILWVPYPPVKAAAFALLVPAPPYALEGVAFGVGYSLASGWGHEDGVISKMDVFTGLVSEYEGECDPFHPDYYQRCLASVF